jgi:glycosyltransferase involved in cell wall biosynthesis
MTVPGVSVIICCHNSASRLPATVRHIALQQVPYHVHWEFIIINNNSTDQTAAVALKEWDRYRTNISLRIIDEPVPGLSHARARGFAEARYDYVLMCDDDNWLSHDYVAEAFDIMQKNPNIAALGGLGKLVYEINPPDFIRQSYIFAAGKQAPASGKVKINIVYGAGCVIRKSAYVTLKSVGFRSFLIDRKGTELSSGGDHELCYALAILGYDIWYDERLSFSHFITKERLTWDYFVRYARESSRCYDVLTSYKMVAASNAAAEHAFWVILRDWFFCIRTLIRTNLKRILVPSSSTEAKLLYFRHVVFKYKTIGYFNNFSQIVKNHREIVNFKKVCERFIKTTKPSSPKKYQEIIRSLFSL